MIDRERRRTAVVTDPASPAAVADGLHAPPAQFRPVAAAVDMGAALAVAALVWILVMRLLPPVPGMSEPGDRLVFALKCCGPAVLLTFATGIEAVAHERLLGDAFDPLAGRTTRRLAINLRYLQNTLEQLVLFIVGLLLLAVYAEDGAELRAAVAATLVWMLARFAFWIGYHRSPARRVAGLVGMVQSLLILLHVSARFGHELAGTAGAAVPVALFAAAEAVIIVRLVRSRRAGRRS